MFGSHQEKSISFKSAGMIPVIPGQFSRYWPLKRLLSTRRSLKWRPIPWKEFAPSKIIFSMNLCQSVKILFSRLRSCFNIFVEFISVRFSKFFLSLADATGLCTYSHTSRSPYFVASRAVESSAWTTQCYNSPFQTSRDLHLF